jgi:hypothetical protein
MWVFSQIRPWDDWDNGEDTVVPTEMTTADEIEVTLEDTPAPTPVPVVQQPEEEEPPPIQQGSCSDVVRRRRPWRDLSCQEQDAFLTAIHRLKDNGIYNDFVFTHQWESSLTHGTALFLPWHRWYTYQFESALQSVADDPCITLPYWDWEQDAGNEMRSEVFSDSAFGYFTDTRWWETARGGRLRRDFRERDFWRPGQVLGLVANYEQYTDDWGDNPGRNNGFRAALEAGPHAAPRKLSSNCCIMYLS